MENWSTLSRLNPKHLSIRFSLVNEATTTCSCPCCSELKRPSGGIPTCKKCGFGGHKNVVGAFDILSRRVYGELSRARASLTMVRQAYFT